MRGKKRKSAFLKRFFITVFSLAAAGLLSVLIIINVFVIKNVEVEGNKLYDETVITDAVLNDEYSWNTLYVFLKYTIMDTQQIPFIDTMEITMKDPQTLHIEVYEKGLLGYLYIPTINQNAYFDKDGFVTETSERKIENVPLIEGLACDEVVLYEKLPVDSKQLKQILTLTQSLKRKSLEPERILYGVNYEPVLVYGDASVYMGSMELLTQKVERLDKILPSIEGMSGILHLEEWSEENSNIVFEKTVEEETEGTEPEEEGAGNE
uniref:cell division protein FtsQ/DivIB n=1 Tax=Agathobacter sp. TaxID=2021311 RepID=UPI004055E5B3